jgi:hypothetical protein
MLLSYSYLCEVLNFTKYRALKVVKEFKDKKYCSVNRNWKTHTGINEFNLILNLKNIVKTAITIGTKFVTYEQIENEKQRNNYIYDSVKVFNKLKNRVINNLSLYLAGVNRNIINEQNKLLKQNKEIQYFNSLKNKKIKDTGGGSSGLLPLYDTD